VKFRDLDRVVGATPAGANSSPGFKAIPGYHYMSKTVSKLRYRPSTFIKLLVMGLIRILPGFKRVLHLMARSLPGGFSLRPSLHRLRGVKLHNDVWIGEDVYIEEEYPEAVEIQDGAAVATRCTIIAHTKGPGKIVIEKYAAIGAGCVIVCASGQTLTIGEGAVISAGSTVSHSIPARTLCGAPRIKTFGIVTVPFRVATTLDEFRRGVKPMRAKNRKGEGS